MQKASATLAALKPGFSAQDVVSVLNLKVVNFSSGSAQIPSDNYEYLNRVANSRQRLQGRCWKSQATRNTGDAGANLALPQQRAEAVRNYLVQQGVPPGMLVAKGYGDTRPITSNDTEEGKFRNRRIEFTVQ